MIDLRNYRVIAREGGDFAVLFVPSMEVLLVTRTVSVEALVRLATEDAEARPPRVEDGGDVEAEGDRLSSEAREAVRRYAEFREAHPRYRSWVEREDEGRAGAPVVELHRDRHGPHPDRTGDGV